MTQETVNEIVLKAVQSGINFIDTSPWYGQGVSEERLGIALKNIPREKYYIATKVCAVHEFDTGYAISSCMHAKSCQGNSVK